jgi:hypothetical protein
VNNGYVKFVKLLLELGADKEVTEVGFSLDAYTFNSLFICSLTLVIEHYVGTTVVVFSHGSSSWRKVYKEKSAHTLSGRSLRGT